MSNDDTTSDAPHCCGRELPTAPWGPHPPDGQDPRPRREQVVFSARAGGFAYRPLDIHCHDQEAAEQVLAYLDERDLYVEEDPVEIAAENEDTPTEFLLTLTEDTNVDLEAVVDELVDRRIRCELNYVVFNGAAGACGCGCACGCGSAASPVYGSPVYASPVYASPVYASPVYASAAGGGQFAGTTYASPVYGSPVYGSPVYGSPVYGSTYKTDGLRANSSRPVLPPPNTPLQLPPERTARVIVLDTGIAAPELRPPVVPGGDHECGDCCYDPPDHNGDDWLDPASGHGTFIAGIVEQLAPDQDVMVRRVLTSFGDGDIGRDIVPMIHCLRHHGYFDETTVLNLSFSGYADREMGSLARAIRKVQETGAVVVASAGNDGVCRPTFPACLPGVIGVGALDQNGPAPFSNHGPWVRACAPGTDLVSTFYRNIPQMELPVPDMPGNGAPDHYEGWARWSGTSFAAPVVSAALARYMVLTGVRARDAVEAVVGAPGLLRVPGLGTVVNLITPTPEETIPVPPPN